MKWFSFQRLWRRDLLLLPHVVLTGTQFSINRWRSPSRKWPHPRSGCHSVVHTTSYVLLIISFSACDDAETAWRNLQNRFKSSWNVHERQAHLETRSVLSLCIIPSSTRELEYEQRRPDSQTIRQRVNRSSRMSSICMMMTEFV